MRQRQVGHADVEPVVRLQLEIALVELPLVVGVDDGDLDGVGAFRQDFLGDEATGFVDRDRPARHVHFVVGRNIIAADADRTAAQTDIVETQLIFPVGRKQHRLGFRILLLVFGFYFGRVDVNEIQGLRLCFVEVARLAVGAKHVGEFLCRHPEHVRRRRPFRLTVGVDIDDVEWLRLGRRPWFEDSYLGAPDE